MPILHLEYDGFDWDSGNIRKVQKHGLAVDEIEKFFAHDLLVLEDAKHSLAEQRMIGIGKLGKDRPAFLVFTIRQVHGLNLIRVISARFMHKKERELYEKIEEKS